MQGAGELVLNLGTHSVYVDPYSILGKEAKQLQAKITESRMRLTAYGELPPRKEETREDWLKRYGEFKAEKQKPKENEEAEAYLNRIFEPTAFNDNMKFITEVLAHCCELRGQGSRITDDVFDNLSLLEATSFIRSICTICRIPIPELD